MGIIAITSIIPRDGGPVYAETNLSRFPVEPWNTATILPFLLIALYWAWKIRRSWREHLLIATGIPLLLVGFIGGGLYHACRCSSLWFQMDYIPIALLAGMGALYCWKKLWESSRTGFKGAASTVVALVAVLILIPDQYFSRQLAISTSYLCMAVVLLLPAFTISRVMAWKHLRSLVVCSLLFGCALLFRIADFYPATTAFLPMGTHFLWHLFGASATHCIMEFIYRLNQP